MSSHYEALTCKDEIMMSSHYEALTCKDEIMMSSHLRSFKKHMPNLFFILSN